MIFDKGSDGICILLHNICIKIPTRYKEVQIQKIAAQSKISPKIYFYAFGICIMERIYGKTLDKCTQLELNLCQENILHCLNKLIENNILHNDLHLQNLMLDKSNKLWIIDFGDAKIINDPNNLSISIYQIEYSAKSYKKILNFNK
jgi:predicted Ser/Thr protein kinase